MDWDALDWVGKAGAVVALVVLVAVALGLVIAAALGTVI